MNGLNQEQSSTNNRTSRAQDSVALLNGLLHEVSAMKYDLSLLKEENRFLRSVVENNLDEDASYCPVCDTVSPQFMTHGHIPRAHSRCPSCGSLERHRAMWLIVQAETKVLEEPTKLLHFAPEKCLSKHFRKCPTLEYHTIDIVPGRADHCMDIQDLKFADNSFDAIFCSHVLEHIPDDRKAIRELCRVLRPNGWAMIAVPQRQIPVQDEVEPTATTPELRLKFYCHAEHMRNYGIYFGQRLEEEGFNVVEHMNFQDRFDPRFAKRLRLNQSRYYLAYKPA